MKFSKIGIVGYKEQSPELLKAMEKISAFAVLHPAISFYAVESLKGMALSKIRMVSERFLRQCDLLIAIGGDGTFLSTARIALGVRIPILGVNAGRIGFLTETPVENLSEVLESVLAGDFTTRNRIMIDSKIYQGKKMVASETVLNEVHIRAHAPERMVNIKVEYKNRPLTEYWADSLLVSTPTGSTAYNLSAGGPIIYPSTDAFVLTPVAPSSLSVRPLIIPTDATCRVTSVLNAPLDLVFDGRITRVLEPGNALVLTKSKDVTTFIRMKNTGFVNALQGKLGWTGKPKLAQK